MTQPVHDTAPLPSDAVSANDEKLTPAMRQYRRLKSEHADALVLFQMGDFYETFYEDAVTIAEALNITLTTRGKDSGTPIPLAGFPLKAVDGYLPRLISQGFRVVIVDQVEDPKQAKGVVKREVTRIVTPGTIVEEALLDPSKANHIAALASEGEHWGMAWIELSTGAFQVCRVKDNELAKLLVKVDPRELVYSESEADAAKQRFVTIETQHACSLSEVADWTFAQKQALDVLKRHFGVATLAGYGLEDKGSVIRAAGALLHYVKEQQRSELAHITAIESIKLGDSMALDRATVEALELVTTLRGKERKHTLLWAMDRCATSMGSRQLREWLLNPLLEPKRIRMRHAAVEELAHAARRRDLIREAIKEVGDLERLAGRIGCRRATPRDLVALAAALERVPLVLNALAGVESSLLEEVRLRLDACEDAVGYVRSSLADEPPLALKDGGVIRDGFSPELDELRALQSDGKRFIARFQAKEQQESGIPSLKVGYTSVFGYYLEITNTHKDKVPAHWIRKQTLKNAERYITPELKEIETRVLNASSEATSLEAKLFAEVRERMAGFAGRSSATARLLSVLDVLNGLATLAVQQAWVRPELCDGRELMIEDGRHPVLERTLTDARVVPNDCELSPEAAMALITGPNMAGKSTYIRMVALLTLMAQSGSFVPATRMRIGPVDRIFTRIGSADEIQQGNSTFMVEMIETANILNSATEHSLIVLDEVGRGTSTFDGVSIAWAVSEHLAQHTRARTLFATHYHELTQLAQRIPSVRNLNVSVREWGEEIVFLHKIVAGASDRSYGIHVARLAGLSPEIVERARSILTQLEQETIALQSLPEAPVATANGGPQLKRPRRVQLALFTPAESKLMKALAQIDVEHLPPEVLRAELQRLKAIGQG